MKEGPKRVKIQGNTIDVSSGFEVAYTGKKSNITISGLVCILPQSISKSFYYGEDFSGFCTSWRTGKIDLRAMNGKDFFQGKVTQDWLLQEGFKKKAILL